MLIDQASSGGVISVGPWGSRSGGDPWSYKPSSGITEITLHEGGNIKSISFKDEDGFVSETFGGHSPDPWDWGNKIQVTIDFPSEYFKSISGTYGVYNDVPDVIISLSFHTNLKTYGPFGTSTASAKPFSIPMTDCVVVGFHGRCGYYLDALGIYVKPVDPDGSISFGKWGGRGGNDTINFTVGSSSWIKQISVHHDDFNIKSLSFKDGNDRVYGKFGGNEFGVEKIIEFDGLSEFLTSISGTYGNHRGLTVITSLSFITNLNTYGPFGKATGTAFSNPIQGGVVVGFHGKSGYYIDSIGFYVKPASSGGVISVGPWGSRSGGDPWSYKPSSGITEITLHEGGNIKSISFKDEDGFISETFGGHSPDAWDWGNKIQVAINFPSEYFKSISGTYGVYNDVPDVIISLSFHTNLKTYGPFGTSTASAKPFSIPMTHSVVVGFHGRSGYYLDALGIYVKPVDRDGSISFGKWGGKGGDDPINFKVGSSSWIKQISVHHDDSNIKSLSFKDGNDRVYGKFGGKNPNDFGVEKIIEFDGVSEFLTSISGTYGNYRGLTVITSLSFITNLNTTYGPFGKATGTAFSNPIQGGVVVGFHGKSGYYIDSIGIYVKPASSGGFISLGPWGSRSGGDPWSYKPSSGITEITLHECGNIKSISFKDEDGFISETFGGHSPDPWDWGNKIQVTIDFPSEYFKSISGTYGVYNDVPDVIISLSFHTNLKTYGPFGTSTASAKPFSIPMKDSVVVGFHGRCGYYLDALGIYVKPVDPDGSISFGKWGGRGGNDTINFTVGSSSWIKQISVHHDDFNIKSLSFKDGNDHVYGKFGGNEFGVEKVIEFDGVSEFLTSISGTYGNYRGLTVITSLSFITNLNTTYGPFGKATGTAFSNPIQGGVVVGFHGKSGYYIDSIGIYVKPGEAE
ncbi:jacalin-related lectin 4-like [Humulus lupulus]|uniref:jacalin-related lectin 4-like n=1 Tax=Humulus lupulus TaxID=3486 RepID=UPI002B403A0A|nr:jacalin-related lectin 4-like [Humulus lupulus]